MKSQKNKYILIGLSIFCIIFIGLSSVKDGWLFPIRNSIGYVLVPVQSGVNKIGTALYYRLSEITSLKNAQEENYNLKEQVAELVEENNRLQSEQFELQRLRELYDLDQEYMKYHKVGARIIAKDSVGWFKVFRIDKGSADGIMVDMNVIAGGGLVGIVTDVGTNYATVRSIIDDLSRVSGMAMQSGDSCIISGDLKLYDQGKLSLSNIMYNADIKNGDKIVTSNISSKYLPGILIGYAADITTDNSRVTKSGYLIPIAEFDNLQEVLVITELKDAYLEDGES